MRDGLGVVDDRGDPELAVVVGAPAPHRGVALAGAGVPPGGQLGDGGQAHDWLRRGSVDLRAVAELAVAVPAPAADSAVRVASAHVIDAHGDAGGDGEAGDDLRLAVGGVVGEAALAEGAGAPAGDAAVDEEGARGAPADGDRGGAVDGDAERGRRGRGAAVTELRPPHVRRPLLLGRQRRRPTRLRPNRQPRRQPERGPDLPPRRRVHAVTTDDPRDLDPDARTRVSLPS